MVYKTPITVYLLVIKLRDQQFQAADMHTIRYKIQN